MLSIKVLTVRFYTTFNKCRTQGTHKDRVAGTGAQENRTDMLGMGGTKTTETRPPKVMKKTSTLVN